MKMLEFVPDDVHDDDPEEQPGDIRAGQGIDATMPEAAGKDKAQTATDPAAKSAVPSRTDLQRREALDHANQVRTARRLLKEQLRRKQVSLATLVADCPELLKTAKVGDLPQAVPGYGPVKAGKILTSCHVSSAKTMAGLTPRQRQNLIEALRRHLV